MIIINLKGGLGNQLFQYAFARTIASKLNVELCLDISYFNHSRPKHAVYGLHSYNIKGIVGNYPLQDSTLMDLNSEGWSKINFYKNGEPFTLWGHFYQDKLDIDKIKTPAYFDGDFQHFMDSDYKLFISDDFFKNSLDLIHDDLKYLYPLSDFAQNIIHDMGCYDSIALHIRHGDYINVFDFGLCSKEYYQNSIDIIASKVDNPKFYIFSDDMDWVKKNLDIKYPHTFVDYTEKIDVISRGNAELLKIMSSCNHVIIANSTLSWWAAFLCENENKIIISPEPWFQNRRVLGVKTIDNKETISVPSNFSEIFNNSENLIYKLSDDNFIVEGMECTKSYNSFLLSNIGNDGKLFLKNINNIGKDSRFIIKLKMESFGLDCLKLFFKTVDNNQYSDQNSFNLYYYDDDSFEHYFLLPNSALIDEIMIKPASGGNNKIIIRSIEIKELFDFTDF